MKTKTILRGRSSFVRILLAILLVCSNFYSKALAEEGTGPNPEHPGRTEWIKEEGALHATIAQERGYGPLKTIEHSMKFEAPSFRKVFHTDLVSKAKTEYEEVVMKDLLKLDGTPGAPILPVKPIRLLIPYKHKVVGVEVTTTSLEYIEGEYLIEPTQEPLPTSEADEAKFTLPDPKIYESTNAYPSLPCEDVAIVKKSGYTILLLNLSPIEYHPLKCEIAYYPHIKVEVEVTPEDEAIDENTYYMRVNLKEQDTISSLVDNPEVLNTYIEGVDSEPQSLSTGLGLALPGPYEYVIITGSAFEAGFQPLINQKISRGLTATIVTTEYINANYAGTETGDLADKIRQFIRDAYNNWATQWVLLGGDIEVVPFRGVYASCGSYTDNALPTDMYFACLDGPWNYDKDSLWGESNDGLKRKDIDLVPDVFVGRAPVSNPTELSNFVAKTINYETFPHTNSKKAVWLAEQLDNKPTWGSSSKIPIKQNCIPYDWNVVERYDEVAVWDGATFISDLNLNPHIINHLGHANETYNARISTWDFPLIQNQNEYPYIMYSQGCYSGAFDYDDSIAEKHVTDVHGGVATVMNSRYGWYAPGSSPSWSHWYDLEFWDALFNEHKLHFAEANDDSKIDNLFRVSSNGCYRWIHFELNLLGDPETPFQLTFSTPPEAPTSLTAIAFSATQINLSWQDISTNETGFKIERSQRSSGGFTQIATVGANVTTCSNTNLRRGTTYYYRVRAYNDGGDSGYSIASATTPRR